MFSFCFYLFTYFVPFYILFITLVLLFCILLSNFLFYKKSLIKIKYFLLEQKIPWSMSAISETLKETWSKPTNPLQAFHNLGGNSYMPFSLIIITLFQWKKKLVNIKSSKILQPRLEIQKWHSWDMVFFSNKKHFALNTFSCKKENWNKDIWKNITKAIKIINRI